MTIGQIIEHLKLYPTDHPTDVAVRWQSGATFCVAWSPSTAGAVLRAFESAHVTSHCLCDTARIDDGEHPVEAASPLLLRAWLGPVPVVLPEGCSVEGGVRLFRADPYVAAVWMTEGYYSISEKGRHVMRLTPEALHWLRTGEVTP